LQCATVLLAYGYKHCIAYPTSKMLTAIPLTLSSAHSIYIW